MSMAKKWLGVSPVTAQSMHGDTNNAITAAGTTLAAATDLTNTQNIVTTATDGQGVQLDTGIVGDWQMVYNATAGSIKVYPSSSTAKINQIAAAGAHILAPYTACQYFVASATQHVAFLSA
mgnify:CR=1 FL=1